MRALVTCGNGFLGSEIVRMLHARGDEVTVLCRKSYDHIAKSGEARPLRGTRYRLLRLSPFAVKSGSSHVSHCDGRRRLLSQVRGRQRL